MFIDSLDIINKEKYEKLDEFIICPICQGTISNPYKCINCQNNFCKICIEKCLKNNSKCPFRCEKCIIEPNQFLEKILCEILRFKCKKGCDKIIPYSNLIDHYKNDCVNRKIKDYKVEFQLISYKLEKLKIEREDMLDEKEEVKDKIEEINEEIKIIKSQIDDITKKIHKNIKVNQVFFESIVRNNKIDDYLEKIKI